MVNPRDMKSPNRAWCSWPGGDLLTIFRQHVITRHGKRMQAGSSAQEGKEFGLRGYEYVPESSSPCVMYFSNTGAGSK